MTELETQKLQKELEKLKKENANLKKKKKFGLVWEEREREINIDDGEYYPYLIQKGEGFGFNNGDSNKNILIEGDNYHALEILQYTHKGKIDVIYIDPPYNTGKKDFKYNDKWIDENDGFRHSYWLSFINKRLRLAKKLLKKGGLVFISIDDNEVSYLKILCDDIFNATTKINGKSNFIGCLPTIMNLKGNNDQFGFSGTHEYTLVYTNNVQECIINEFEVDEEEVEKKWNIDKDGWYKKGRTIVASGAEKFREDRELSFFPVLVKNEKIELISDEEYVKIYDKQKKVFNDDFVDRLVEKYVTLGYEVILPRDTKTKKYLRWEWGFDGKFKTDINEIMVVRNKKGNITLYKKQRPELGDMPTKKPKSTLYRPSYSSGNGTNLLAELVGDNDFDNPKPIELIKDFVHLSRNLNKETIFLDFFAGSGTLAHAVMDKNYEDERLDKYIIVTNNENNIAEDITHQRLLNANQKYNYNSNLEYLKTELLKYDHEKHCDLDIKEFMVDKLTEIIKVRESCFELNRVTPFLSKFAHKDKSVYILHNIYNMKKSNYDEAIKALNNDNNDNINIYILSISNHSHYMNKISKANKNITFEPLPENFLKMLRKLERKQK